MGHTPGPWKQGKAPDSIIVMEATDEVEYVTYSEECLAAYGGYVIAESVHACNRPLIMAAPELLAACKKQYDMFGGYDLAAVITKAEGRVEA